MSQKLVEQDMTNLIAYILALILTQGRFSCVKAAMMWLLSSHDRLTRALLGECYRVCTDWDTLPPDGYLVIDDTVLDKRFSKQIEGVSFQYSSNEKKVIPGLCFVFVLWVKGSQIFVVDIMVWQKGGSSKNELLQQLLKRLHNAVLKPKYVLFDAWYAAYKTLNLISAFGWRYVARIKNNRYFNGLPLRQHRFFGAKALQGKLRGVFHEVQIVKHEDRYLVTNDSIAHNTSSVARLYGERWVIEVVIRELKDVLHLQECSSRSLKAQEQHVHLCFKAFFALKTLFPSTGLQTAQIQLIALYTQGKLSIQQLSGIAA